MSKQVTYYTNSYFERSLIVRTTYNAEPIDKVIIACKGTVAKEFYPQDKLIAGYSARDLALTAQILRELKASPLDLKNFTEAFELGYKKAYEECKLAIEDSINKMFEGFNDAGLH
jgi:hypothetical protein